MDTYRTPPITQVAIALSLGLLAAAPPLQAAVVPCEITIDFSTSVPLGWSADAHASFRREATRVWKGLIRLSRLNGLSTLVTGWNNRVATHSTHPTYSTQLNRPPVHCFLAVHDADFDPLTAKAIASPVTRPV